MRRLATHRLQDVSIVRKDTLGGIEFPVFPVRLERQNECSIAPNLRRSGTMLCIYFAVALLSEQCSDESDRGGDDGDQANCPEEVMPPFIAQIAHDG